MSMRQVFRKLSKEAAAEMNEAARVEHCILVIRNNIEFFIYILKQPESITSDLSLSMDEVKKSPLVQAISHAFVNDTHGMLWVSVAMFRNAICGDPREPGSGLIYGGSGLLEDYLKSNPLMLAAILKNQCDPVIEKWKEKNYVSGIKEQKILRDISASRAKLYPEELERLIMMASSPTFFESPKKNVTKEIEEIREIKPEPKCNLLPADVSVEKNQSYDWKTLGFFAVGACVLAAAGIIAGVGISNKMK